MDLSNFFYIKYINLNMLLPGFDQFLHVLLALYHTKTSWTLTNISMLVDYWSVCFSCWSELNLKIPALQYVGSVWTSVSCAAIHNSSKSCLFCLQILSGFRVDETEVWKKVVDSVKVPNVWVLFAHGSVCPISRSRSGLVWFGVVWSDVM